MTDVRLRELERRFHETHDVEDEAAWLSERIRAGSLAIERVALAARLGHAASLRVATDAEEEDEDEWWEGSGLLWEAANLLGPQLPAAVACLWVEPAVRAFEAEHRQDRRLSDVVTATRNWLACPCERHASETRVAGEVVEVLGEELLQSRLSAAASAVAALADTTHADQDRSVSAAQAVSTYAAAVAQRQEEARWQRDVLVKLLLAAE